MKFKKTTYLFTIITLVAMYTVANAKPGVYIGIKGGL